jgi:hypothetical protein
MGYRAFKIHGWNEGDKRIEAENLLNVRNRVGDRMELMIDPACELRTFADALYVGRACDEADYFWYEDPFRDAGTSAFAHKKLREMLDTPLLQTEHIRGVEPKADFIIAGGTTRARGPEYDMGDYRRNERSPLGGVFRVGRGGTRLRAGAPPLHGGQRNSNYYEVALVGPDCPNAVPLVGAKRLHRSTRRDRQGRLACQRLTEASSACSTTGSS